MAVDNTTNTVAKNKRLVLLVFVIAAVLLTTFFLINKTTDQQVSQQSQENGISQREVQEISFPQSDAPEVHAWIANTPTERSEGLAVTDTLLDHQAMLFVFDQPGIYPFWMKDMQFSIDIIWLNEDKEVVYMHPSAQPEDYPKSYHPYTEALYVLEVVDGFINEHGIERGEKLRW